MVSVPCRGLNLYTIVFTEYEKKQVVSVPCRGLNLYTRKFSVRKENLLKVFPSPVGDLIYIQEYRQ